MTIKKTTWFRQIITLGHPYKQSVQREQYEEIAETCGCSPDRVYEIAHGAKCKSFVDDSVLSELKRKQIVRRG